jgi:hypothetical protein
MATDRQIAANRLNAQKSTGPKTPEGRAAIRLNSLTHGLTAQTLVLPGESEEDFGALLASLAAEHDPATSTEHALVTQLAMATWRLRRLYHQEAGFYAYKLKFLEGVRDGEKLDNALGLGLVANCSQDTLSMFNRQEARLERTFYKALHELERLRTQRPEPQEEVEIGSAFHSTPPEPQPEPFQPNLPNEPSINPTHVISNPDVN